ncbi:MAG: radical SAM protein [Candidatus Omnitrophica bacterium]|nr:radical SAM protein [Candidatus Omnitrophota bacterium]MDD5690552.1 radical SAM protein [Candidatus Omnitrophota bacterium]
MIQEAIVFLNPPYKYAIQRKLRCSPRRCGNIFPPLELLYLASLINEKGSLEIIFTDAIADRLTLREIIDRLKKYRVRIIVFMPGFESLEEDLKTISKIKESLNKDCRVISFGYLPTLYFRDIFKAFPLVDYIIMGEPEITFKELYDAIILDNKDIRKIKGLALNQGTVPILNEARLEKLDLNCLPFPNRKLLRNNSYSDPFLKGPMTSVITSRGCPHRCVFCVDSYGHVFRRRAADNVVRELKHIVYDLGINNVRFMDDNFTADRNNLISICKGIIENKIDIAWTCLSRVDTFDKEMLAYMARAGCKAIFLGIESGSQKILDYYKKGYSVDIIKRQCRLIKEAGIDIVSWFVLGAPIETLDDIRKSLKLSLEIDSDFICLNELRPMPATDIFNKLRDHIRVSLFPFNISYAPFSLSAKEVARLRRIFYIRFYFSPKIIWKILLRFIRNPENIMFFLREFISATRLSYIEK